jgi:dienelactone hydrolase
MKNRKHLIVFISLFILCLTHLNVIAQLSEKYSNYEYLEYQGLKYGFYKPLGYEENKSYPLVMVLNGFADTMNHDFVYYKESFQIENPCFVLAPKCYGNPYLGGGWADMANDTLLPDGKLAIEIMENTIQKYNVDEDRLYLHGGSMGGIGTLGMISNHPEKFAAGYVVCGGATVKSSKKYINTPLWILHGELDDVVPVHLSGNIYNEIVELGGKMVRYTVYPGVKHNSWINASKEKTLVPWMFKQEKGKTAGTPDTPKNLTVKKSQTSNILTWELPKNTSNPDNEIWYYIILRNDKVLTEVDGDVGTYSDGVRIDHDYYNYRLIAVNYYFKKSKSTGAVKIKE